MAKLKITLVRGKSGHDHRQIANLKSLGLNKTDDTVVLEDTAVARGMVAKVQHLVKVEEVK
ncbi:MAG: 50S ribosomal protein L30 [Bacteroidales bacterium]|nr:50S ribosomal protein L30 [Bacteroidales bacterium]